MTAPALILLVDGSTDSTVIETIHQIRHSFQCMRQGLSIHLAFLDQCPPSGPQVVNTLAARGVTEMVFVTLSVTHAIESPASATEMVERVRALHPDIAFDLARPLGPASKLLNVLDDRLRAALSAAGATEVDALILSVPEGGDPRGAALINRRARQWSHHHKLPCVVAAGDNGTSVGSAVSQLHAQGRRHIAVGSLYLAADEAYRTQAAVATRLGAVVSGPIGDDERLFDVLMSRYSVAAMSLVRFEGELADAETA